MIKHILENQEIITNMSSDKGKTNNSQVFSLLSFTLQSNKVYIGFILEEYNVKFDDASYISLIPLLSGYRDEKLINFQ